jgi:hypothetical protein
MTDNRDKEEDLRNLTYKGLETAQRVFKTLTDEAKIAKFMGLLVKHLQQKELLSEKDLDALLLEAVGPRPYSS